MDALHNQKLDSGASQKLAGRLTWATQALFHRVGRAMVKPIYAQKCCHHGAIGPRLKMALRWWASVLERGISENRAWCQSAEPIGRLFVDAASTPARCAGVLFADGQILYTDVEPDSALMASLENRGDNQIMSLVRERVHTPVHENRLQFPLCRKS